MPRQNKKPYVAALKQRHDHSGDLHSQIFTRFSNQVWAQILKDVGVDNFDPKFRRAVETALSNFSTVSVLGLSLPYGTELLSEPVTRNVPIPAETPWYIHDLQAEHMRLVRLGTEYLKALGPHLCRGWDGSTLPTDEHARLDRICAEITATIEHSRTEANRLASEKSFLETHELPEEKSRRGAPIKHLQRELVFALITAWETNDGRVTAWVNGHKAAPLVRFLCATMARVLQRPPKQEAARAWINKYRKCNRSRISP